MNRHIRIGVLAAAALLSGACSPSLDVPNLNAPDIARALASPEDIKKVAASSVNTWYLATTYYEPFAMMAVTADQMTANFGNFGMRFNNLEPRDQYQNSSAGGDRAVAESPYNKNYGALGAANDALKAIANGVVFAGGAAETDQYRSLAQFTQAAALSNLGLIFDQAFIVDEKGPAAAFAKYPAVIADAMARWDVVIAATVGKTYTFDASVFPLSVGPLNGSRLNRLSNTMAARTLAYSARTKAETEALNWGKILAYADKGISGGGGTPFDVTIVGDGANNWYSYINLYGNRPSWMRVDMRTMNMMDPNQPAKYTGANPPPYAGADARGTTDFFREAGVIGDPARGIYMQSPYSHRRYYRVSFDGPDWSVVGALNPFILAAENDLLIAEGLVRTNGDLARAATLINNTRVTRGQLPPVTAATGAAGLLAAIFYERDIEILNTDGIALFDHRRVDNIQAGTVRHLPVPAKELETLSMKVYTFGGPTNPDK